MKSNYASVTEQAGIYAGDGGYDIRAEDDTHLKGAVIASTAKAEKNRLTTGTLTMEDIENKADYDVKGIGVSYNHFSTEEAKNDNYNETGFIPNLMPGAEKKTGTTTRAAISEGTITVAKEELDIEKINRDTADSLHALEKIFDKDKIEERQELAKLFAKNADELLHKYDRDGTFDKALAHGIVAEITSQIAGNEAGAGFAAGFTNEILIKKIDEWAKGDPAKAQWISAALGATVNGVIGKNRNTGAAVTQYGTKWNNMHDPNVPEGEYKSFEEAQAQMEQDLIEEKESSDEIYDSASEGVRDAFAYVNLFEMADFYSNLAQNSEYTYVAAALFQHALHGNGESQYFNTETSASALLQKDAQFVENIKEFGKDVPIGETRYYYFSIPTQGKALLAFGNIKLSVIIKNNGDGTFSVRGEAGDVYDFAELGHKRDTLNYNIQMIRNAMIIAINNDAFYLQQIGKLRPFIYKIQISTVV